MPHSELIEDRLRFLEIDESVLEALRNARQTIEPELDHMLGRFYAHLANEPELMQIFADDKTIERARAAQRKHWLKTLFGGQLNSAYFDKAEQIGRSHARVGLTPNWYIGGYCKMLVQFIRHISVAAEEEGRDATAIIEAVCKAVLLDLDIVIHCYLEAKDETMLGILERATNFAQELAEMNSDLAVATAQVGESARAALGEVSENDRSAGQHAKLLGQIESLADKVKQVDERISQRKTGDRLYAHKGMDKTGTFSKLKALILGE